MAPLNCEPEGKVCYCRVPCWFSCVHVTDNSSCWDGLPFGHNRHWPKSGGCCAFPRKGHSNPNFSANVCCALSVEAAGSPSSSVAWAEAYLCTKWYPDPSNHLATIHQRYRQTGQTGQRTRSISRTVTCLTVAQKPIQNAIQYTKQQPNSILHHQARV